MAEILTSQADIDRIFKRLEREYNAFNEKQQAYAIREIGRVRGELADMLADFADDDGTIKRRRIAMVLRELDEIETSLRERGTVALETVIKQSSEWTTRKITKAIGISLSKSAFDRVSEYVIKYVVKRFGEDGLVLSDRIWGLSGEIRDELSSVIRSSLIRGDGINAMIPRIRRVYENETWKIRRLARNESVTAHRAAISYNARESDVVKWVKFHAGVKRSEACVALARENRYGIGPGVFKPTDTDIWMPHVNCTSYISYILDERGL